MTSPAEYPTTFPKSFRPDYLGWCSAHHSAACRIHEGATEIHQWTTRLGIRTQASEEHFDDLLTVSSKEESLDLASRNYSASGRQAHLCRYKARQTWKLHIEEMDARAVRRPGIVRKLSGPTWGSNSKILKTFCTGAVQPMTQCV